MFFSLPNKIVTYPPSNKTKSKGFKFSSLSSCTAEFSYKNPKTAFAISGPHHEEVGPSPRLKKKS